MLTGALARELAAAGAPPLDAARCLRGRFVRASCRRCADACPRGAVTVGRRRPRVDAGACGGCRLCEASCPAGALGDPGELGRAIEAMRDRPRPVLGCRLAGVEAHGRVSCVGQLDGEALVALAAAFEGGLTLNLAHCGGCPGAAALPAVRHALEELAGWAGGLAGRLRTAETRAALGFEPDPISRRDFLSVLRRGSRRAAAAALGGEARAAPEPPSAKRLPAGRRALLRVVGGLPPGLRAAAEARWFGAVSFGPACTGCTGCAGVCPTGALTASDAGPPAPVFEPSACTDCGLCAEFCRRGAAVLARAPTAAPAARACP